MSPRRSFRKWRAGGKSGTGHRWRWRFASMLNRHPRACWSQLVMWCLPWSRSDYPLRRCFVARECRRQSVVEDDCCYCGKVGARSPGERPDLWAIHGENADAP